jgi:hypothetical protein
MLDDGWDVHSIGAGPISNQPRGNSFAAGFFFE